MNYDRWTKNALEPFFNIISKENYENDKINCCKVICKESTIIPNQLGVFANTDINKGDIVEWGVACYIPGIDVRDTEHLFSWSTTDRSIAATVSGCGLYYNTLGDKSNCRCVPYHSEMRFEIYALEEIKKGTELTFRYDSMNYREGMKELIPIVGELLDGDK